MATVWIPALLRKFTQGAATVQAEGSTVGELIDNLEQRYPGIKARLLAGEQLKPTIALVVDGETSKQGLRHPVQDSSEVHFVPAVSGG